MATADNVITIPRLRQAIGEVGDTNDTLLTSLRAASIVWLERWIGRNITDKTAYASEPDDFAYYKNPEAICFLMPDIKSGNDPDGNPYQITIRYANYDDDPQGRADQSMQIAASDTRCNVNRDGVIIYAGDTAWSSTMRFDHPVPYIEATVGMDADSIPAPWGEAIALMVRAIFDGSSYDQISEMSALNMLLSPWKGGNFTTSVR